MLISINIYGTFNCVFLTKNTNLCIHMILFCRTGTKQTNVICFRTGLNRRIPNRRRCSSTNGVKASTTCKMCGKRPMAKWVVVVVHWFELIELMCFFSVLLWLKLNFIDCLRKLIWLCWIVCCVWLSITIFAIILLRKIML